MRTNLDFPGWSAKSSAPAITARLMACLTALRSGRCASSVNQTQPVHSLQRASLKSNRSSQTHETSAMNTKMNTNQYSTMLENTKPTKLPCAVAPTEWRAAGHLPSSMQLWRRTFCIPVLLFLVTVCVPIARAQTALMNGTNQAGTLLVNTTNSYTFTANAGDNIVLRLGSTGFEGNLHLDGPTGALLKTPAVTARIGPSPTPPPIAATLPCTSAAITRVGAALMCCIWLSFPRPSLCLRARKAAR